MKKLGWILLICLFFAGCSTTQKDMESEVNYIHFTDLHHLSKTLYEEGETLERLSKSNDSKLFLYSEELLSAICDKAIEEKPDAVLISGDLTFNGELVSLKELKKYLRKVEEAGVDVLVIPGNHDINYPYANKYMGSFAMKVDNIPQATFLEEMKEFGYEEAIYKDTSSFSYAYAINDREWVIALDANTEGHIGDILDSTLQWLDETLTIANEKDIFVTVMSHQNVLRQNENLYEGFVINNADEVVEILKKHNVKLCLSGHSHIQHVSTDGDLADYCTESYVVYPLNYATIEIYKNHEYSYATKSIGIYQEEAKECFDQRNIEELKRAISELNISEEEKEKMVTYALDFNRAAFSDNQEELRKLKEDSTYKLWQEHGGELFWFSYMEMYFSNL